MVRAFQYGLHRDMPAPVFYAQIETIEGVENARAIAAVDGVDVLFIGPMDLKLHLQSYPGRTHLDFAACLREVADAARDAGKACGLLCRQTDDFTALQALGFTHLAIETDITLLRETYRKVIQPFRTKEV
jgi:2-dehydro-3-deoxyglucarate aldolase/4-hydroxy-2-oxoheptanedioate aldolase